MSFNQFISVKVMKDVGERALGHIGHVVGM